MGEVEDEPNAAKLTEVYLKIKTKRAELSASFKEADSALSEQLDQVRKALLTYCEDHGLESVRTPA